MFCQNCGNNCQNAKFCPECGQDLRTVAIGSDLPGAEVEQRKPIEIESPKPPIGRYNNHDHDYIELGADSITIHREPLLAKSTSRTIPYTRIKGISLVVAKKLKSGGFLSIQDRASNSKPKSNFKEAANDECSIVFSWKQNESFSSVYEFLKIYADRASKNHQAEKWPSVAQQMIDDAVAAREYEKAKNYIPAQKIESSTDIFEPDKLTWYPGKKKDERKAKIAELEKSGQVYCPKCLSTSISANQKGFGFVRGALGANLGLDVGLIAGGVGSKKVICTCLKCGYQWKAGKK